MNYKMILYTIGRLLKIVSVLLLIPLIVALIYQEAFIYYLSFIIPALSMFLLGVVLTIKTPKKQAFYAREGFVITGLSWIVISLFGALPFVISNSIPSFVDAVFETVSGFTTTGASILNSVSNLNHSILFWRSFTHWVGGMGVLVFILAIMPDSVGQNIYILKAESPGPQVGKLVSKVKVTARILYIIYFSMTVLEAILLMCGGMQVFDSIVNSFATAGTGGFAVVDSTFDNAGNVITVGMGIYSTYCQVVIGIFMLLFGVNFNVYYLLLIKKAKEALKSEELRAYLIIVFSSVAIITINLLTKSGLYTSVGKALLDSFFQVASIITTTGFATADYVTWPQLSQVILFTLMFVGACAGSTGGGLKVSRVCILFKSLKREIKKMIHPNSVSTVRFEDQTLDESVVSGTLVYTALFAFIFFAALLILSLSDVFDFTTNISAVAACINNIGPGLNKVGPMGNYAEFNDLSKITLTISMLIGRLEIYPIIFLFNPRVWRNK